MLDKITIVQNNFKELDIIVREHFTAVTFLPYNNAFQCLIATLLSHRTRDVVTEKVCMSLFKQLHSPVDLLCMTTNELHDKIRSVNYCSRKVNILRKVCTILYHNGHTTYPFPSLPYVGKKTQDVLQNNFDIKKTIAVDSNIIRFATRYFGSNIDIHSRLYCSFSSQLHYFASSSLISFARTVCSTKPQCFVCKIRNKCKFYEKNRKP